MRTMYVGLGFFFLWKPRFSLGQMLQVCNSLLTVYSMRMFCWRAAACQTSVALTACLTRQLCTGSSRMLGRRRELSLREHQTGKCCCSAGDNRESCGKQWAMRMRTGTLRKVGNQVSETTGRVFWRPTGDHKDHLNKGKIRGLALARTKVGKDKICFQTRLFEYTSPSKSVLSLFYEILLYFNICIQKTL